MAFSHRASFTAPLPSSTHTAAVPSSFDNLTGLGQQPSGLTQTTMPFFPTFLNDIIGNEKIAWTGCYEMDAEGEGEEVGGEDCDKTPPKLDEYRDCPFISVALNGEELRLPLPTTNTTEDNYEHLVTPAMDPFPSRQFFDLHVSMIIPFDTVKDEAWDSYEYDVTVDFENATTSDRRSYFLGTLTGGLQPAPIVSEKLLFKPTTMTFKVSTRNWKTSMLPCAGRPEPDVLRLIGSILKLLELKCVTGSGPIKATRLRSDIKETSSNELIIAGLKDMKWTEFLKKLHDQGYLWMTSKGQENWVSLLPHDKEDCTNSMAEKRNVAQCMTHLLQYNRMTPISDAMDMLFDHPKASGDLWKMMSPNWKTLRRILVSQEANEAHIHLDPCGDGCVKVSLLE